MKKVLVSLLLVIIFLSLTFPVLAQVCDMCGCNPETGENCGGQECNKECWECLTKGRKKVNDHYEYFYTWTVLGCLPREPAVFVTWFLRFAMGIGGGVAFLFMVMGAFKVLTSGGDVLQLSSGKKMISRAILGILVIVFAVIILRILGYDILRLPGFEVGQ